MKYVAGVLACALVAASFGADAKTTLKFGHIYAPNTIANDAVVKFADKVAADTGGEVTVRNFPAQQLGDERTLVESLMAGELDMTPTGPNVLGLIYPGVDAFELPYLYRSYKQLKVAVKDHVLPYMNEQMKGRAHAIAFFTLGMRQMMTNGRDIRTKDDLKGLKMRSPQSEMPVRMWKAFGAAPVVVSFGEIYTAIQTGVVDGCELPPVLALESHLEETLKSVSRTDHLLNGVLVLTSEKAYARLGAHAAAVQKAADYAFTEWMSNENMTRNEQALAEMQKKGLRVIDPGNPTRDALAASMTPIFDEYMAKYPSLKPTIEAIKKLDY